MTFTPRPYTLSKSDFKVARTCASKLYFRELGYPDAKQDDPYMQLLAEGGYMVELLAKLQHPDGVSVDYSAGATAASTATMNLLVAQPTVTLFEATLFDGQRLARVDILAKSPSGFDLYEVKAASYDPEDANKRIEKTGSPFRSLKKPFGIASDWCEYLEDVTYQVSILKDLFPGVPVRSHLVLVDKESVATVDELPRWFRIARKDNGRLNSAEFIGDASAARANPLTVVVNVDSEVAELEPGVRAASAEFCESLTPVLQRISVPIGGHCAKCEFRVSSDTLPNGFLECWGERGLARHHVLDLYQGRDFREELIAQGINSVTEITDEHFAGKSGKYAERQMIQVANTRANSEWFDADLKNAMSQAQFPLHFIDFEAARSAIPHHIGMHPYGLNAFQWSCHTVAHEGAPLTHREFVNTDVRWPNEEFARTLRDAVGDIGTVLVWSPFEGSVLKDVARDLHTIGNGDEQLANWLGALADPAESTRNRILDLLKLCRSSYYRSGMGGSNSIKAVLDAIWKASPEMRTRFEEVEHKVGDPMLGPYAALPPLIIDGREQRVADGTGAIRAYEAMVYGAERDDPIACAQWKRLLLDYCRLDTLAMVLIWEHWERL